MGHLLALWNVSYITGNHRLQCRFKHVQCFIEFVIADDEWHEKPDHISVGTGGDGDHAMLIAMLDDLLRLFVGRLESFLRPDQLDRPHRAHPMDGADDRILLLPFLSAT